jgi:EmrB/QacA subfamily drug resistance transporter
MIATDNSIVITGLPRIREGLGFAAAGLSWVQNAYALSFGGLMLLGARAGDLIGRRRMLIVGLAVFTAASLAIGLAGSPAWLIGARAVQGAGAAILAPSTLALLSTTFEEGPARSRALGWYGAVGGITASVGLVVGGIAADLVSWRAGFFINVPIGLLLMWATLRHVPESAAQAGRFDLAGSVLSTLGMVALVYGLVHAAEESWTHWGTWAPLTAGVVLLSLFLMNEARAAQPLLPLRLFASRERSGAHAARVLFIGAVMGFFFYTTQYLQGALGMRPLWAGIAFLPAMLVNFAAAMAAPRLARRFGNARVLAGGLVASMLGMGWLGQLGADTPFMLGVLLPMMLVGAGMGASLSPLTIIGVAGVQAEDAGSASGLVGVAHQLGGSLGLALLVVVFALAGHPGGDAHAELAHRVGVTMSAGALMQALALIVVLVCIVRRPASPAVGAKEAAP